MDSEVTIKTINTKRFKLGLFQASSGMYYVVHQRKNQKSMVSEPINDYNTASYMFDLKLKELEGN